MARAGGRLHSAGGWWLAVAVAVPAIGFAVLLASPRLDQHWEHHPSHFWLVVAAAAVTAALAYATGDAASRRGDARLFLMSLSFLSAGGFLALHALATPGILLETSNLGFLIAVPVGLMLAAVAAAASTVVDRAPALAARARALRVVVIVAMLIWGVFSLARVGRLSEPATVERASSPILVPAAIGAALLAAAAWRYLALARRKSSPLPLAVAASCALLAEALVATALARNWHGSWWEWHLLILAAFALVATAARREWADERFSALYGEATAAGQREVSVLFADLAGFTAYSERRAPADVSEMLNQVFAGIVPVVVRHGGEVDSLIGDAVMATFNVRGDQPDHPRRAAETALAMRNRADELHSARPDWPRLRIGVNTGDARVGVLGTAGGRRYTVIGDAVNVAARLQAIAPPGGVVIGARTLAGLTGAGTESLGDVAVKGRAEPVSAFRLEGLRATDAS